MLETIRVKFDILKNQEIKILIDFSEKDQAMVKTKILYFVPLTYCYVTDCLMVEWKTKYKTPIKLSLIHI